MCSMDAYKALQEKDARLLNLQKRRKRLAELLAEEREQLHVSVFFFSVICLKKSPFYFHNNFVRCQPI